MDAKHTFSTQEKVAIAVSGAIVLGAIVYWGVQLVGVLEIVELAYG